MPMEELTMTKTIKFNLICDNNPVRTIEDLQNNFSIEDVLEYYSNRLLHRWLEVRGYLVELKKTNAITSKKPLEIIKKLIKIFNIICDEKKVEESIFIMEYLETRKKISGLNDKENYNVKRIINNYKKGYTHLVDGIIDNPNDVVKIKANIAAIVTDYEWVLALNYRELFWILKDKSVLALMCFLMNMKSRDYYLPKEDRYTQINEDNNAMDYEMCNIIQALDLKDKLGENLHSFAGETEGYWKTIQSKGKKYMIIGMERNNFIRSAGVSDEKLAYEDVTNKFVILDGIDYKSNISFYELWYMEV